MNQYACFTIEFENYTLIQNAQSLYVCMFGWLVGVFVVVFFSFFLFFSLFFVVVVVVVCFCLFSFNLLLDIINA